jgi:hypothetical protein
MHTKFVLEVPMIRDYFEDLGIDGKIVLKFILKEMEWNSVN